MKLTDLDPHWVNAGLNQPMIGISFVCPHCRECGSTTRLAVYFAEGAPGATAAVHLTDKVWQKTGDTFDTMSFTPSIDASAHGHWHGFITNGEIR